MTSNSETLNKRSLFVCVASTTLTEIEKERIAHPLIAGVILFSRNFESSEQVNELIRELRASSPNELLITVDNEGGRVQRFKTDGFTHVPAMGVVSQFIEVHNLNEREVYGDLGYLMASEAISHGIDCSFAPVLDIQNGSDVVGDRAFSNSPMLVTKYASSFISGMKEAGMQAIGKHFPGHGSTKEDSHFHTPVDDRTFKDIDMLDLIPFKSLIKADFLQGIMPAHIRFPKVDKNPVGYSEVWLSSILKQNLRFDGAVFSDDLAMVGASEWTEVDGHVRLLSFKERLLKATKAGCDFSLICNQPEIVDELLATVSESQLIETQRQAELIKNLQGNALKVDNARLERARQLCAEIHGFGSVKVVANA